MKKPLPPVLRAALYRRAVACAWLTVCERQHRYSRSFSFRQLPQGEHSTVHPSPYIHPVSL